MATTTPTVSSWDSAPSSFKADEFWHFLRRFGRLSTHLGIDLGTSKTAIYLPEQGIALQEPTLIAIDKEKYTPIAFGAAALPFIGRHPEAIDVIHPIQYGQIEEPELTAVMLKHFLHNLPGSHSIFRPRVSTACNRKALGYEYLALHDVMVGAGTRRVTLIDRAIAAAIGAELSLEDPTGHLIVDIGAGTTDIAVVNQMGTLVAESIRIGGVHVDRAIHHMLRQKHHLLVSDAIAEQLKIKHGSVAESPELDEQKVDVVGLDLISSQCTSLLIRSVELQESMMPILASIVDAIACVLERTSATLLLDIAQNGMLLTGGGALLTGIEQFLGTKLNMPVKVAPDPMNAIARGIGYTIENTVPNCRIIAA